MNKLYIVFSIFIILLFVIAFGISKVIKKKSVGKIIFLCISFFTIAVLIGCFCYFRFSTPILKVRGNDTVNIDVNSKYVDDGYTLIHPDSNLSKKVKIINNVDSSKVGKYEVLYIIKYYNKEIKAIRNVNVIDNIKPVIELKGDSKITIKQGINYVEKGYTATDNYDGDLTDKVEVINNIKDEVGEYDVIYKVKDSSGNEISIKRNVTRIKNNNGVVYLTFDDGPSSTTYKILDILKDNNVKATFFVVNYGSGYDPVVKRIVDEGHTLALHSYTHNYKYIYASVDAYFEDLNKLSDRVKSSTGVESKIIRFPGGSSNTVSSFNKGIMSTLVKEVKNRGYHYFDWNVDSRDAGGVRNSTDVYNNVMSTMYINRANVVLMHDHANNYNTINTLDRIIKECKAKGFSFDKITYDTPMVVHGVRN